MRGRSGERKKGKKWKEREKAERLISKTVNFQAYNSSSRELRRNWTFLLHDHQLRPVLLSTVATQRGKKRGMKSEVENSFLLIL